MMPASIFAFVLKLASWLLLAAVLVLSVVAFFAVLEILLTVGALFIAGQVEGAIRQNYALASLRNVWLLVGGALLIGFVIGGLDHFARRLDEPKARRRLLWILALELLVIAAAALLIG